MTERLVSIPADDIHIQGLLELPLQPRGLVVFAHGSGSSRHSPRNNYVASVLRSRGIATLLLDLLAPEEDQNRATRFDIPLLTQRLLVVIAWARHHPPTQRLPLGLFGASTGAAAALMAAAQEQGVQALVSRGGRPDLAQPRQLASVQCPTLLIVGSRDEEVLELNRQAASYMQCTNRLVVVAGATHLFEETGTLETVARLAADWFEQYLHPVADHPLSAQ